MHKINVEGTDLLFHGDHLIGAADKVADLIAMGMQFAEHDDTLVGFRDGAFYALCGEPKAFRIGSVCKESDYHYRPESYAGFVDVMSNRYQRTMLVTAGVVTEVGIREFKPGKGKWVASTQEDALEMAVAYKQEYDSAALARAIAYGTKQSRVISTSSMQVRDAVHRLPKYISMVYEAGLVVSDKATGEVLQKNRVVDGTEIVLKHNAFKVIGRYIALRGELVLAIEDKSRKVEPVPITVTIPQDYPVFVS